MSPFLDSVDADSEKIVSLPHAEEAVLAQLSQLKQQIIALHSLPARVTHKQLSEQYQERLEQLAIAHRQRKKERDNRRHHAQNYLPPKDLDAVLHTLEKESQRDGIEKRRLKQERQKVLGETTQQILQADKKIAALKQQYKALSKEWQATIQSAYFETTANQEHLNLSILYRDEHLVIIDKPAGLLSVPGRRYDLQDSAIARLKHQLPTCSFLQPVHRLDRDTSGILAIALSPQAHKALNQQFAQRQVHKTYEAVLSRAIASPSGKITLPLWGNPVHRPKQTVDFHQGKPSQTTFKRLTSGNQPRVKFTPQTGRTHQLRVHAAHPNGLNAPILGDALYGDASLEKRLHLHATQLAFNHPISGKQIEIESAVPF